MKISGDCPDLNPQPLPSTAKCKEFQAEDELKLNKSRLVESRTQMKLMKEQIKKYTEILQKEVGEGADVKELLRYGHSPGWQGRTQMIMNLRIKLTAMRSKFLDPPHKMYYRGPFDPKKEFDLKYLPEKQENLYKRMLEEKKIILQHGKPVELLKKELDDLSLMYRAARFRTKSLVSKVNDTSRKVDKAKEKAEFDLRVVEAMMAHQSVCKMMIDPKTFQLDPTLKRHTEVDPLIPPEVPEWSKFKMKFDRVVKEKQLFRDAVFTLAEKMDKINKDLVENEKINIENRLFVERQSSLEESPKKDKQKGKGNEPSTQEEELKILTHENDLLREFLLHSVLSTEKDFKMFLDDIDGSKQDFINALFSPKENSDTEESTKLEY